MIPRLRDAADDLKLHGPALVVYLRLLYDLDPAVFRPVKQFALAHRLQLSTRTVRRSLNLLVELGYIERGPSTPNETREYRLVYSRMP